MVTRIRGFRGKSRSKLRKSHRQKGKISINRFLKEYSHGDRVCLSAEPAVQNGMYHPKFHGKIGTVKSRVGNCYHVNIVDIKKEKTLIVHPVHLKLL